MESSGQREIELKYRLEDETLLSSLRHDPSFLDQFSLGPRRCQQTVDIYWDTVEYALTRSGFGLRTRRQDDCWLVTLKELALSPASALANRVEVEAPLDAATLSTFLQQPKLKTLLAVLARSDWPPSAWQQVQLRKANPALRPLAVLQQMRDKRALIPLDDEGAKALGELSLDAVQIYAPPADLSTLVDLNGRMPAATFREVEIEAAQADQIERFRALATRLGEIPRLIPSEAGKAESALRWLAQTDPDGGCGVNPSQSAPEAGRLIWRQQLMEVLLNEAGVRRQNEDAVHDMRVAIRRMRAAQRIFGPYFDEETIKPYLRTLRKTARILGAARDLDVALDLLGKYEIALPPVRKAWQDERQAAYANVRRWLGSKSYSRFVAAFDQFCRTPGLGIRAVQAGVPPQRVEVRHVLPMEIFSHFTNMRVYGTMIDAAPLSILHQIRIEGKRLRYALESIIHLLDPEIASPLVQDLKQLQDRLGSINDAAVMSERLRRFGEDHPQIAVAPALSQLDRVIEKERASFAPLWADFISPEKRKQMALVIADL
jgi:CHAD domain-containing protein